MHWLHLTTDQLLWNATELTRNTHLATLICPLVVPAQSVIPSAAVIEEAT